MKERHGRINWVLGAIKLKENAYNYKEKKARVKEKEAALCRMDGKWILPRAMRKK